MIPNPILKVLSSMAAHQVQCLLMGGQACVFYGAAEFSRDSDFVILAEPENLERLKAALHHLQAEPIAVPDFDESYLHRGHAVHFSCRHPECSGLRVDVMSVMRGVDSFPALWERRTTLELSDGTHCHLLSVPDLVKAKKTQRDKDWPMIRRLVEANFFEHQMNPTPEHIDFWLRELRTPELLIQLASQYPKAADECRKTRRLLSWAVEGDFTALEHALREEETAERNEDREYWLPLKKELEALRRLRVQSNGI